MSIDERLIPYYVDWNFGAPISCEAVLLGTLKPGGAPTTAGFQ